MMRTVAIGIAMVIVVYLAYCSGYRAGCKDTTVLAVDAIREVKEAGLKAVNDLAQEIAVAAPLTGNVVGQTKSVCAVMHSDGGQCESDGKGGYLPRESAQSGSTLVWLDANGVSHATESAHD